ncbi:MAG: choice-of-anchor J domain-containing protein [Planctomycetes bacterium]|nr:choice-of-anchor J domain-containing protein [Planctomycetota bacterium]
MINRSILTVALAASLAGGAWAQTTYLSEDFNAGVIPPAGWVNQNNNAGPNAGWQLGSLSGAAAFHDDSYGANDYTLGSGDMDLSGAAVAYLHMDQSVNFSSWRAHHYIDVSTDAWATFTNILDDLSGDGASFLTVDLSAYAGTSGVAVGFHYTGDYASEWTVDNVLVTDSSTPPPPPLTPWAVTVPSTFVPGVGVDDLEGHAGTPPAHMALNAMDGAVTGPDADAHCTIDGSSGFGAASGSYCLEMGLDPLSNNYHIVSNAMVLGVQGSASAVSIDMSAVDHGDEVDGFDGVWISNDGANWANVLADWLSAPYLSWGTMTGVALDDSRVDTTQDFFVMFAQQDNFPYAYLDGIGLDDIDFGGGPSGPALSVTGLVGGSTASVDMSGCSAGGIAYFGYSLAGAGPTSTPLGDAALSAPFKSFALSCDSNGDAGMTASVPAGASGLSIWFHGADLGTATFTNAIATSIG